MERLTVDQTITVLDDKVAGGILGSVSVNRSGGGTGAMPVDGVTAVVGGDGTVTFSYDDTLTGEPGTCVAVTNTATVPGDSDDHVIEVCSPTVTKTADATFDRTHLWALEKSVDRTSVTVAEDGTATFGYTVKVSPAGHTDEFRLSGSITVANPSTSSALTVSISDAVGIQGAECTVEGGTDVVVPADESVTVDYTCALPDGYSLPAADPVNTATATWGDERVSGIATVDWALDERTDAAVTVTDDKTDPANPVELGVVTVDEDGALLPGEGYTVADGKAVFTYEIDKTGVAGKCTGYTNVATVDLEAHDDLTDKVTVEVCSKRPPKPTPAPKPPHRPHPRPGLPSTGH